MESFSIYTRSYDGLIEFKGKQEWRSLDDLIEYYLGDKLEKEDVNMIGWNHEHVTWYGNVGVANENT